MPSDNTLEDTDMAVPRRKTSPSRRGMRRSADALKKPTYAEDKDSGELRRPHHLDLKTGMYKGRQVLKAKKDRERSRRDLRSHFEARRSRRSQVRASNSASECGRPVRGGRSQARPILLADRRPRRCPMVGFPLLLIPLAIYNIIAFLMPGVSLSSRSSR